MVRTDAFDRKYAYSGEDLGATFIKKQTGFKVWAPTAAKVELITYKSADPNAEIDQTIDMTSEKQGRVERHGEEACLRHRVLLQAHLRRRHGEHLGRSVRHRGRRQRRALRSALEEGHGQGGQRMPAFGKTTDASIAEMNIRDFSINPASGISADKQGKYLGVVESGTKTAKGATSGLDYLEVAGRHPRADHADVRLRFRQRDRRPESDNA